MEIANDQLLKALGRAGECMRRLIEAGLTFEDLQTPIDSKGARHLIVKQWKEIQKVVDQIEPFFNLVIMGSSKDETTPTTLQKDDELYFNLDGKYIGINRSSVNNGCLYFNQHHLSGSCETWVEGYDDAVKFCGLLEKYLGLRTEVYMRQSGPIVVYAKIK